MMTTLERPVNKARRVGKLEKPAPLKRSLSVNTGTDEKLNSATSNIDNSAEQICANESKPIRNSEPVATQKTDDDAGKENTGLSSRRLNQRKNIKLVKPRPLRKKSDETVAITEHSEHESSLSVGIIGDDSSHSQTSYNISSDSSRSTYLSQMSRDSGIGDMERADSRNSCLGSVGEYDVFSPEPVDINSNPFTASMTSMGNNKRQSNDDDLDWDDLDEPSEPFVFGHQHLKHTSYAVNQAVPFNSFMEKDINKVPSGAGRGCGRSKSKPQSHSQRAQNPHYIRSYSVPDTISQTQFNRDSNNNEDWELEIEHLPVKVQNTNIVGSSENINNNNNMNNNNVNQSLERLNQANNESSQSHYPVKSNSGSAFSEDWESDLIDTNVKLQCDGPALKPNSEDHEITMMRLPRQADSVVFNYSVQTKVNQGKDVEQTRIQSPEPTEKQDCDIDDVETTPKAKETLARLNQTTTASDKQPSVFPPNGFFSTYSPYFPPVQKTSMSAIKTGELSESSSRSTTPVNGNAGDIKISPVKDPWEILQEDSGTERDINSLSYRNKSLDYDTCSSGTKTSDTDAMSTTTSEDNFIDQQNECELLQELTGKLQAVVLDGGNMDSHSVCELERKAVVPGENLLDKHRNQSLLTSQHVDNDEDIERSARSVLVPIVRQPLSPTSMLQQIWEIEQTQPGGMYSAKGRRKMFRNYAICRELETATDDIIIQYTADELLKIGASPMCRKKPDTWSYLTTIYPEVCLKDVTKFFDIEKYREEREYVLENYLVRDSNRVNMRQASLTDTGSGQGRTRPFDYQRSISMPAGNGARSSSCSDMETSSLVENQPELRTSCELGTRPKGFGTPDQQGLKPKGFGMPREKGTRPKGFGAPDDKQETRPRVFGNSDLDTKCDISVRSNGLSKVFSENGEVFDTGYLKLDKDKDIANTNAFKALTGTCFSRSGPRNYSELAAGFIREHSCSLEDDYCMNSELPEKCPW